MGAVGLGAVLVLGLVDVVCTRLLDDDDDDDTELAGAELLDVEGTDDVEDGFETVDDSEDAVDEEEIETVEEETVEANDVEVEVDTTELEDTGAGMESRPGVYFVRS